MQPVPAPRRAPGDPPHHHQGPSIFPSLGKERAAAAPRGSVRRGCRRPAGLGRSCHPGTSSRVSLSARSTCNLPAPACCPPQPAPGRPLPGAWVAGPPEAPVTAGCGPASRGPAGRRRPLRAVRGCERCPCPTGCCDLAALLMRSAQDGRGTTARPVGHRQMPRRWRGSA